MAFDTFLYFTGASSNGLTVEGESTDTKFGATGKKAFEIYSFSWGASNPVTIGSGTSGTGGGKVSISSFNIMKKTDKASPTMFMACAGGDHFPQMDVVMRKAGGKQVEYLTYTFKEVFVESIQWSGSSGGDDTPSESVSFAFGSVQISYTQQKADGTPITPAIPASWDQRTNTKEVA